MRNNDTKSDTILDNKPVIKGQTCSEQLFFDIVRAEKMTPKKLTTYEKKMRFIELRAMDVSFRDIAEILCCSKTTLTNWEKKMSDDIEVHKKVMMDEILKSYQTAKSYRLKHFSDIYRKIKAELDRRSFQTIPSDKLFMMLNKCSEALDKLSDDESEVAGRSTKVQCIQSSIRYTEMVGQN